MKEYCERRKIRVTVTEWRDGERHTLRDAEETIEIIVDLDKIARELGRKAVLSKTGKSKLAAGLLVRHVR